MLRRYIGVRESIPASPCYVKEPIGQRSVAEISRHPGR